MRGFAAIVIAIAVLLCLRLEAAVSCVVLDLDPDTGKVTVPSAFASSVMGKGKTRRVPAGSSAYVRVLPTNTVLFAHGAETTAIAAPEIEQINTFLKQLKPYLPDLAERYTRSAAFDPENTERIQPPGAGKVLQILGNLDLALYGGKGMWDTRYRVMLALEAARKSDFAPGQKLLTDAEMAGRFTVEKKSDPTPCGREPLDCGSKVIRYLPVAELLTGYADLTAALLKEELLKQPADTKITLDKNQIADLTVGKLLDLGRKAMDESDKLIATAYRIETLASIVVNGCDKWSTDEITASWDEGNVASISRAPRKIAEIERLNGGAESKFEVKLLPRWFARPALGLAFTSAGDAQYPTFGTAKLSETEFRVIEKGEDDRRFGWGVTLGLTWPKLDGRDHGSPWVWWVPELYVNPSDDVKSVGVGTAVSWRFVKLGAGAMWTRHSVLDGQTVGDVLSSADAVATGSTYGEPKIFFSLSLIGWQPFVN